MSVKYLQDTSEPLIPGMVKVQPVIHKYVMPAEIETKLRNTPYEFGYGELSNIVYLRTYSRLKENGEKESFHDTVIRVINGVISIAKDYRIKNSLKWDEEIWDKYAEDAGKAMLELRFLPPGRGIFIGGTEYSYERGSAAFNNCGFCSIKEGFLKCICWTMDSLMCGCGIGFDTNAGPEFNDIVLPGCEKCRLNNEIDVSLCDCDKTIYKIHDSRQGWVKSVYLLVQSYFDGKAVFFDYSSLRKLGEPIKGFGGESSGPEPLKILHSRIRIFMQCFMDAKETNGYEATLKMVQRHINIYPEDNMYERPTLVTALDKIKNMDDNMKQKKTYGTTRLIADIFNSIGICIVAGNVRRSSEISLGSPTDEEFTNLKNYKSNIVPNNMNPILNEEMIQDGIKGTVNNLINGYIETIPEEKTDERNVLQNVMKHFNESTFDESGNKLEKIKELITDIFITIGKVKRKNENEEKEEPELNPERLIIGWMSNNTVCLDKSEDFELLPQIAQHIRRNGEPGILNRLNGKRYGRYGRRNPIGREAEEDHACVTADTLVKTDKGDIPVSDLIGKQFNTVLYGQSYASTEKGFWSNGIKDVYEVRTESGKTLKLTLDHKLLQHVDYGYGWVPLAQLDLGEFIVINNVNGDGFVEEENYITDKIIYIEYLRKEEVFDCTIPEVSCFSANGIIAHNCGVNPCVTGDTLIQTMYGYQRVDNLVGKQFVACVNGKNHLSTADGFWSNGVKDVYELKLNNGSTLKLTDNHKILTQVSKKQEWKELKELTVKDKVVLTKNENYTWSGEGNFVEGYVCGQIIGDGTFSDETPQVCLWMKNDIDPHSNCAYAMIEQYVRSLNPGPSFIGWKCAKVNNGYNKYIISSKKLKDVTDKWGIYPLEKKVPENGSYEFTVGLIKGLFDADGTVLYSDYLSVRLGQNNIERLQAVQKLLFSLGIFSSIYEDRKKEGFYELPNGNGSNSEYFCKAMHELSISGSSAKIFYNKIGFFEQDKMIKLHTAISSYTRGFYNKKYNSNVKSITYIGKEEVFDCTIPEVSCFSAGGIIAHNCSEILLEPFEYCNLAEIFPTRCNTMSEKISTATIATIYASTISLLPTHWEFSNRVIAKNRRIGVSMSGIVEEMLKVGVANFTRECRDLYEVVRKTNKKLADEVGVPESIRVTTVKPSGTISQLAGVPSGIHYSIHKYCIRRVRVGATSKLVEILKNAGYSYEYDAVAGEGTLVFSFPLYQGSARIATEVSMWEQAANVNLMQREWSDNSVSCTIYFDPETEGHDLEHMLSQLAPTIKCISCLPHTEEGSYKQMPYEGITKEKYEEMLKQVIPINSKNMNDDATCTRGCDGDSCDLASFKLMNIKK